MRLRVVAVGLVLAACSGGDDAAPVPSAAPTTTAPTPATTVVTTAASTSVPSPAGRPSTATGPSSAGCPPVDGLADLSLSEGLAAIPELSTFAAAHAAMFPPNSGTQFTVLAPIDSAFAAVPDRAALLASPERTTGMVTLHMIPQRRMSAVELTDIGILQHVGVDLSFTNDGGVARVNGAQILCPDIETANGTIHLIDAVLTPPIDEETVGGSQLYEVDLATGATTPLGAIGSELGVIGLTIDDETTVYGVTDANELITFDPADPAAVTTLPITGVAAGSTLIAMRSGPPSWRSETPACCTPSSRPPGSPRRSGTASTRRSPIPELASQSRRAGTPHVSPWPPARTCPSTC
ncbi:hypothetical protein BH18ACT2_BH18ACT2_05620 [soil metagenome]